MWERIELLMNERNLRISDVAKGSGVSYSTLTDWKSGRYVPKRDKIEKIADFFGVIPDFIEGKTERREKIHVNVNHSESSRKSIKEQIADISEAVYQQFLNEHPEYLEQTSPSPYDDEEIQKAISLYELYQSASPEVRAAIAALLKLPQSDT